MNSARFSAPKKPKEASFGVNPVHDLYRNDEKYTQPGRFAVNHLFINQSKYENNTEQAANCKPPTDSLFHVIQTN